MAGGLDGSERSAVSQLAVSYQHSLQEASRRERMDAGSLLGKVDRQSKGGSGCRTSSRCAGLPRSRLVFFPDSMKGVTFPFYAFDQTVDFQQTTAHHCDGVADRLW